MASRDLKGLTIEIGGDTSNLTDALRNVDGELSNLQSNLRTVNSALRLDPGNVDALAQRQALLTDAVAETTQRLELLREAQSQADQQIANGVEIDQRAYRNLQSEIIRAEASLADYQRQANDTADASRNAGNAANDAGDNAEDSAEGWTVLKGTIADLASNAIQNVISSIGNLAGTLWNLDDDTRELRTNMGKLETAFQTSGYSVDDAKEAFNNFYAIVADEGQATEAVSHLAKLTDSQKELEEWTTIATGVYATFGDSLPIENLTEAANETAKTAQLTGGLADALNWAGVNEDEFQKKLDATNSEFEREALIRETLTGLYGDAAAAYRETNDEIMDANEAQARYNSALAGLGGIIEPLKTAFRNGMASMLEAAAAFLQGIDMETVKASIKNAFDYLQNTVFPTIKTGIQWFIDNKDLVIGGLAGIVAGIAAFKVVSIVQTAVSAFKAFQAATTGLTLAQKALNLVMSMNPIGLVIAAITGLVAAFVVLWNNCEAFRNFWINIWKAIENACSVAWKAISGFFSTAWSTVTGIWSGLGSFFSGLWSNVQKAFSSVGSFFKNTFSNAWTAVKNVFSNWGSFFGNLWTTIKNKFSTIGTNIASAISGAVKSGINGVISAIENTINRGVGLINGAIDLINKIPTVSISKINKLSLPRLASGHVAREPMVAEIGEYAGASRNPEIVTPQKILRETFEETLAKFALNNLRTSDTNAQRNAQTSAKLDALYDIVAEYLPHLAKKTGVYVDKKRLVGELISDIDEGLGEIANRRAVGSV